MSVRTSLFGGLGFLVAKLPFAIVSGIWMRGRLGGVMERSHSAGDCMRIAEVQSGVHHTGDLAKEMSDKAVQVGEGTASLSSVTIGLSVLCGNRTRLILPASSANYPSPIGE